MAIITGLITFNYWFSYILFLIIIGGILVLFIYITRIASNEKFNYSSILIKFFFIITTILIINLLLDSTFIEYINTQYENLSNLKFNQTLTKFINYPYNFLLFRLISYLFIALIAVVKISKIKYGPLRQIH